MKTQVIFDYDEASGKWNVFVTNVIDKTKAVQAFNAVLLTTRQAKIGMEFNKAEYYCVGTYKISVEI